jgi:uncharacterized protein YecE (DUF72 family)
MEAKEWPVRDLYRSYLRGPSDFLRGVERFGESLAAYLRAWERHAVSFGASSWLSPRWIGTLYGRWYGSRDDFVRSALEEYSRVFTSAFLEMGPYGMPPDELLVERARQVGRDFRFAAVVQDETLMYRFPYGHPDRMKRGELNERFLEAEELERRVLPSLRLLGPHLVVLRCAPLYATERVPASDLLRRLDRFLAGLPRTYRWAVETGSPELVLPEYRACLHDHNVAHLLRQRSGMPPILDQLAAPEIPASDFCVLHVETGGEESELAVREMIRRCREEEKTLYVYIEESSGKETPVFVAELLSVLNGELARLSPFRRKAA